MAAVLTCGGRWLTAASAGLLLWLVLLQLHGVSSNSTATLTANSTAHGSHRAAHHHDPEEEGIVCFKHNETVNISGMENLFGRAMTDADLEPLYMANLLPDIAHWARLAQQRGRLFTVADIVEQMRHMLWSPYVGLLLVQGGIPYRFRNDEMPTFAVNRIKRLSAEITRLHASGHEVPNTIIIFNAEDVPVCFRLHGCRVPVYSTFKRMDPSEYGSDPSYLAATQGSTITTNVTAASTLSGSGFLWTGGMGGVKTVGAGEDFADEEILFPNFNQDWDRLCFYPWEQKNETALMRASLQVLMNQNSTRYYLAMLSASSAEAAELLDAGIVWNDSRQAKLSNKHMRHFLGMKKHARWRFLLNTDGHSASSRLGHLLGLNSVVLKERSPWIEYYYRALDPGKDHIVFEPHELLPLLKQLRAPEKHEELQRMATAGQRFAHRYLHTTAKAMYARQAIIQYNKLFKDIESFVARLPLAPITYQDSRPPNMLDLLSTLSDLTGVQL